MKRVNKISLSATLVVIMLCARVLLANGKDEAKDAFNTGVKLFEAENYKEAAAAFRKANELNPSWKIQYNIGQSEAACGRYGLAMEAFQRYLVEGKDEVTGNRKDYVLGEMRRLKDLVGELNVKAKPGSEIYVDQVLRGRTPLLGPLLVEASTEHEVVVVGPDKKEFKDKFVVWAGREAVVDAELQSEPESKPVAKEEPAPAIPPQPKPTEKTHKHGLKPLWVWIGVGATGAFGGVALGMDLAVRARKDELTSGDELDKTGIMQKVGIGFLAATGVAAVTTTILAIFTDFKGEREAPVAVGVAPGRAVLAGRF